MDSKFVCTECGCKNVTGDGAANAEVEIDQHGNVKVLSLDWEDFGNLTCDECGSDSIVRIGKGMKYSIAM